MPVDGWLSMPFSRAVAINPPVRLVRGEVYPFADMNAVDQGKPTVRPSEERPFSGGGSRFEDGDTLFARITPCLENGKIARFRLNEGDGRPAHGSTEFIVIRGRKNISDTRFAYYLARSPYVRTFAIGQMTGSSGRQRVPTDCFDKLQVNLPPIDEQRAIAGVLGALDDKIDQNRKTARALERLAQAIFLAWFVDFEPVKAKAGGVTSFPSMPKEVFDALPTRFVDSEIGPVPEGWEVKPLTNLFEVNPPRSLRKGALAPHLDMKNMPTDGHAPDELSTRPFTSGAKFANGDTLVARITPCLENGKTAFVDFLKDEEIAWGSTEYIVLKPHSPIPPIFAYFLARTDEFRSFAIQAMTGTSGRQRVPFSALDHFSIAAPQAIILAAFGELIEPLIACSSNTTRESRSLAKLRDSLLPPLLSGALRVGPGGSP